jgi:hypothetical protein
MVRSLLATCVVIGAAACGTFTSDAPAPGAGPADGGMPDGGAEGGPGTVGGPVDDSLSVDPVASVMLVQGTTTKVTLTVRHGTGTQDPSHVSITAGLRDGITANSIDVPATATTAELSITVPSTAAQGPLHLTVSASIPQRTVTAPVDAFVRGAPGALDTTFGTNGLARHLLGPGKNARARDLVVLPDDRLLAVATCVYACVVRTSADGVLDTSYGTGGSGALQLSFVGQAGANSAGELFIGANGGAGSITVGKLTATGQPDSTFGTGTGGATGTTLFGIFNGPPEGVAPSLVLRKDGSIILGFPRAHGGGAITVGLAARTAQGAAVATFGTNGVIDGQSGGAPAIGARANGNVWFASNDGSRGCFVGQQDGTSGANDPAFTNDGSVSSGSAAGGSWGIAGATALGDGSLVAAVHSGTSVKLPKFAADGSHLDLAWGVGAIAQINEDAIPTVSVDSTDHVLVTLLRAGGLRFARLGTNGSLDKTFGTGGTVVHSFGMNHQIARALFQKDGRIIVLGTEDFADGSDITLTRYWN